MSKWIAGVLAGIGLLASISGAAQASTVYFVSSTSVTNCSGSPHGLWTGQQSFSGGTCGNYYDVSPGTTFTLHDDDADPLNWTGNLDGFAINPQGYSAEIHLTLMDFAETAKYKTEGGASYDQNTDTPDIDFFQNVAGTIAITDLSMQTSTYTIGGVPNGYSFQWGEGGNAKNANEFGGSVWLNMLDSNGLPLGGHWDLNLTFSSPTPTAEVPEPGVVAIFGLGLLGLGLVRRRRLLKI